MKVDLPASWRAELGSELEEPYFAKLSRFVDEERKKGPVYPPEDDVFSAFKLTPFDEVRVVILGQDPYHGPGQAQGLCFSVRPGVRPPPSLVNIFKEAKADLEGFEIPKHGDLRKWAREGVLLLNAVLTVREGKPNSHKDKGWERFTDAALERLNADRDGLVFLLWGAYAQKKAKHIDPSRHAVLQSAHPSPLSAKNGFFGSRPFSSTNAALRRFGKPDIDWKLPREPEP